MDGRGYKQAFRGQISVAPGSLRKQRRFQRISFIDLLALVQPSARWGSLLGELLSLLLVLGIEMAVLAQIIPHHMVDLTCPYLSIIFVTRTPVRACLIMVIAAFTWELHTSMPAGTYLCAYLIALTVISILRKQVAWRNYFPWLVTGAAVQLGIVAMEFFLFALQDPSFFANNLSYVLAQGVRIAISAIVASLFYFRNSSLISEESPGGSPS